jgi:hypothetical protein
MGTAMTDSFETIHIHCTHCQNDGAITFGTNDLASFLTDMGERTFRTYIAGKADATIEIMARVHPCPNCGGKNFAPTLPVVVCGVEILPAAT